MQVRRRHRNRIEIRENEHVVNNIYYNYFNGMPWQFPIAPQINPQSVIDYSKVQIAEDFIEPHMSQLAQQHLQPSLPPFVNASSSQVPIVSQSGAERDSANGNTYSFGNHFTKGLQIGINYRNTNNELHGCIEDTISLTNTFRRLGIVFDQVKVLTDDTPIKPTKANMLAALEWLVADASPGDRLFLQYSGHGSQERGNDKYETDGMNETLCPLDIDTAGHITDDQINKILCKLPENVSMFFLSDCCHSGTNCDLAYTFCLVPQKNNAQPMKPVQQNPYYPSQMPSLQPAPQPYYGMNYNSSSVYSHGGSYGGAMSYGGQYPYGGAMPYGGSHYPPQTYYGAMSYGAPYYNAAPYKRDMGTTNSRGLGSLLLTTFTTLAGTVIERYASKVLSMFGKPLLVPREGEETVVIKQLRPENVRARIITLSGCNDHETSQEFNGHGAMTTVFLKMLEKLYTSNQAISCEKLLREMYTELIHSGTPQQPQICSSFKMNANDRISFGDGGALS